MFGVVTRGSVFITERNIPLPTQPSSPITLWPQPEGTPGPSGTPTPAIPAYSSLVPVLIYFLVATSVMGLILFLLPVSALKIVIRLVFAFMFCWGLFIILSIWLPMVATVAIAGVFAVAWFVVPKVWLHNLVMIAAMVAVGALFGHMIAPWTVMVLLLALAIYDFLAVRLGYMVWLVGRLSDSNVLPAFYLPRLMGEWNTNLNKSEFSVDQKLEERKFSILGGGDIGFPLLLISSVYFARGLAPAAIMGIFSLVGLVCAYWVQAVFLKGKPMPALPPIAVVSLIGLLIAY